MSGEELEEFDDKDFFPESLFHSLDTKNIKDTLICPLFPHFLEDPLKCPKCETHICKKCFQKSLEFNEKCPLCRVELSSLDGPEVNPSKILLFLLENLKISCENHDKGCTKTFFYKDKKLFNSHIEEECLYTEKPCPNYLCSKKVMRKDLDSHIRTCLNDNIHCEFCDVEFTREILKSHIENKECFEDCHWCTLSFPKTNIQNHINECDMSWVLCLYCQATVIKKEFRRHRESECGVRKVWVVSASPQGCLNANISHRVTYVSQCNNNNNINPRQNVAYMSPTPPRVVYRF